MYPYPECFVEDAAEHLGEMYEYAVYYQNYAIDDFQNLFLQSEVAHDFAVGDIEFIAGMSGIQMAHTVLWRLGIPFTRINPSTELGLEEEYWAGMMVAKFQWRLGIMFEDIHRYMPMSRFVQLFHPYHMLSDRHILDEFGEIYSELRLGTVSPLPVPEQKGTKHTTDADK